MGVLLRGAGRAGTASRHGWRGTCGQRRATLPARAVRALGACLGVRPEFRASPLPEALPVAGALRVPGVCGGSARGAEASLCSPGADVQPRRVQTRSTASRDVAEGGAWRVTELRRAWGAELWGRRGRGGPQQGAAREQRRADGQRERRGAGAGPAHAVGAGGAGPAGSQGGAPVRAPRGPGGPCARPRPGRCEKQTPPKSLTDRHRSAGPSRGPPLGDCSPRGQQPHVPGVVRNDRPSEQMAWTPATHTFLQAEAGVSGEQAAP